MDNNFSSLQLWGVFLLWKSLCNFQAVNLRLHRTHNVMLWSSCAVDFMGQPDLGLSLTVPVAWNLSLRCAMVDLWTAKSAGTCSTLIPACNISTCNIPIAWFQLSLLSFGIATQLTRACHHKQHNTWLITVIVAVSFKLGLWFVGSFKVILKRHGFFE